MAQSLFSLLVTTGVVVAGGVVIAQVADDGSAETKTVVTRVIDGDTVEVSSGERVRLVGIDTPERGECGFNAATGALRSMVENREVRLVNPATVQDLDRYGRLLRYVDVDVDDSGLAQIKAGLGSARYDSRDGYEEHPRESEYRATDRGVEGFCERREAAREKRQAVKEERWRHAKRLARRADIVTRDGESALHVIRRAKTVLAERRRLREQAHPQPAPPAPAPEKSNRFVPPPGWTTDALTPGYTGCRQGYPGGEISGVYVWKPIQC
jgi:endonuclease YncB( thermonuclease family)